MILRVIAIAFLLLLPLPGFCEEGVYIEVTKQSYERGMGVFMQYCRTCHGLKYYRDPANMNGIAPLMDAQTAEASFGAAPPDLSLMASARGKGIEGAEYIYRVLTTYTMANGKVVNKAFAEETQTEGMIAMPQPIASEDPQLRQKAKDVSAFLFKVSEPSMDDRASIGPWVLGFMAALTLILFLLNRYTWEEVKRKKS